MHFLKVDNFKRDIILGILTWVSLIVFYFVFPSPGIHDIVQKVFILGLFAMSLNILIGYLGLIAFGHAAFFATGAYTLGLFLQSNIAVNLEGFSIPLAMLLAVTISSALAAFIGFICIRLKDIYFSFIL